jgi:hypothetical protein
LADLSVDSVNLAVRAILVMGFRNVTKSSEIRGREGSMQGDSKSQRNSGKHS